MLKLNNLYSYKKISIGFLILCFGLSSVNAALATEAIETSPIIVQPYDLQDVKDQMLAQDRINRDQELAIKGLVDDNQRLAATALANQQDDTLDKVNQTMIKYRDYLVSRDQTRIMTNGQRISKYHDLIKLTEDVDDSKDIGETLLLKNDVIQDKYKILTDLKNEMVTLNEKLKGETVHENFVKTPSQEGDKVQLLTQRLAEMDQRIAHYDEILAQKDRQIALLKDDLSKVQSETTAKDETIRDQQQQIAALQGHSKNFDLKAKDETIRWLNQVNAVLKNKVKYYQITTQQNKLTVEQVRQEVQQIKDDFARRFKSDDQFENAIGSLKDQVGGLGAQLTHKQEQVNLLKSELENKINEASGDDRLRLAHQLINVQQQEASLLEEELGLRVALNTLIDQHALNLESRIKKILANHQIQFADLNSRTKELKSELYQQEQQVELLRTALQNKIAEEKNQTVLTEQTQDLKVQLQDKEHRIAAMKAEIQSGQVVQDQLEPLKQQLVDQQNKLDALKQELDAKTVQSGLVSDYQKKLESKNDAYNEELKQVLASKNDQGQMEVQIADLNTRLQEKEAQVVKIKKDLYDLRALTRNKDMALQAKDLSLSMVQEKTTSEKIKEYEDKINSLQGVNGAQAVEIKGLRTELALARQQLSGMPSSDEIDFLRTGYKKATMQLKQKDEAFLQIKANADEYLKEFKAQSLEFQSLKEQLQDAFDDINRKNEDLKYKKLELVRYKELSTIREGDLMDQVKELTRKLNAVEKTPQGKIYESKVEPLVVLPSGNGPLQAKLKQALDKINEQGRLINVLVQKLQDAGKSVDLTRL